MRAGGGAAAWHFVPVVGGTSDSVPIRQLMALEKRKLAYTLIAGTMLAKTKGRN